MPTRITPAVAYLLRSVLVILDFPARTYNMLSGAGIKTVEDLLDSCPRSCVECRALRRSNNDVCPCRRALVATEGLTALDFDPQAYLADIPGIADKTIEHVIQQTQKCINNADDLIHMTRTRR